MAVSGPAFECKGLFHQRSTTTMNAESEAGKLTVCSREYCSIVSNVVGESGPFHALLVTIVIVFTGNQ